MNDKKIIRVFPRKNAATPRDDLARFSEPLMFDEADEIHISVTFTWDIPRAEKLYDQWKHVASTTLGGPAYSQPAGDFVPGMYLRKGYVITSRGCPNRCWFCNVWKVEKELKELPITEGYIVQDDNLLACSEKHIIEVFEMLSRQKERPKFTGGLEAKLIKPWHAEWLKKIQTNKMYFAYDTPDDYDYLVPASRILKEAGFKLSGGNMRCYVLVVFEGDTFDKAESRIKSVLELDMIPHTMLYMDRTKKARNDSEWKKFHHYWNPASVVSRLSKKVKFTEQNMEMF